MERKGTPVEISKAEQLVSKWSKLTDECQTEFQYIFARLMDQVRFEKKGPSWTVKDFSQVMMGHYDWRFLADEPLVAG